MPSPDTGTASPSIRTLAFMDECEAVIERLRSIRDQVQARTPPGFSFLIKDREQREEARSLRREGLARVASLQAAIDATIAAMANLHDDGTIDYSRYPED